MTDRKQTPDVLGQILGGETLKDTTEDIAQGSAVSEAGRKQPSGTGRKRSRPQSSRVAKKQKWEVLLVSFQEHRGWRPRYRWSGSGGLDGGPRHPRLCGGVGR